MSVEHDPCYNVDKRWRQQDQRIGCRMFEVTGGHGPDTGKKVIKSDTQNVRINNKDAKQPPRSVVIRRDKYTRDRAIKFVQRA